MEWPYILLLMFGSLLALFATGMPVALSFLLVNLVGMYVFFGTEGFELLITSLYTSLSTFVLLPIPMFILMGEVLFHSGTAPVLIETIDKWLGRLPGRLSLLAVAAGVLFASLTGTSLASVAMLGSVLVPEMEKRGYKKSMSLGPIMGSGGLAIMIPPSALAVLLAAIGEISVGKILLAIIVPGLLMAAIYSLYIIIRCSLQPSIAPPYAVAALPLSEKVRDVLLYVLPQGVVIFLCIGVILLGITTPGEAAATGCIGTVLVATASKRMSLEVVKKLFAGTISTTVMLFLIICSAIAFSQILAYSGASAGLTKLTATLNVEPIMVIVAMQIVVLILGCFMEVVSIMMITLPIFVPVVRNLGFDPVWFAAQFMINVEIAGISPPFGLSLFVMKGVAPTDTTMGDVYRAAIPFCLMGILAMTSIIAFPPLALWLPGLMRR